MVSYLADDAVCIFLFIFNGWCRAYFTLVYLFHGWCRPFFLCSLTYSWMSRPCWNWFVCGQFRPFLILCRRMVLPVLNLIYGRCRPFSWRFKCVDQFKNTCTKQRYNTRLLTADRHIKSIQKSTGIENRYPIETK
jgi:hypothetical protein